MNRNLLKSIATPPMLFIATTLLVYADADENFIKMHGAVNRSFVEGVAETRASKGDAKTAKYMKIKGNEEFQDAIDAGQLTESVQDSSKIQKQYIVREIEDVDIDDRDLEGIDGDTLNLGAEVEEGNVVQLLNIKDSKIDTEKHIVAGVSADGSDANDITSITSIKDSDLSGGSRDEDQSSISTSKYFDE